MAKYTVSTDGTAGPYLAVEAKDIEAIETLLRQLDIVYCKSSDSRESNTGGVILRVYNIEPTAIAKLNNILQQVFP